MIVTRVTAILLNYAHTCCTKCRFERKEQITPLEHNKPANSSSNSLSPNGHEDYIIG